MRTLIIDHPSHYVSALVFILFLLFTPSLEGIFLLINRMHHLLFRRRGNPAAPSSSLNRYSRSRHVDPALPFLGIIAV